MSRKPTRKAAGAALAAALVLAGWAVSSGRASRRTGLPNPPIPVNVLVVAYDPVIESMGGARLHAALGWQDPKTLTDQLVADFAAVSHGAVQFKIVGRVVRDEWPLHVNGRRYTDELYLQETANRNWTLGDGDYGAIIRENGVAERVNGGSVDEVWLWGAPGFGWWESAMAGNGAFWVNGGPITGFDTKAFILMGLNYERGMPEALESFGHRAESILSRVYGSWEAAETHDWNRFALLDRDLRGRGGVGNSHNAFNAEPGTDYNRTSLRLLPTSADDWIRFPDMTGVRTKKNCTAWGSDGYGYLKWWYAHMPHVAGLKDGLLNNWWRYLVNPDLFKATWRFPPPPEADFAEGNAAAWSYSVEGAIGTLTDAPGRRRSGASSLRFRTSGAFDTMVRYPGSASAGWDLTGKDFFSFWAYAENTNQGLFQNNSPVVRLVNAAGGTIQYAYLVGDAPMNGAVGAWKRFVVPLAGGENWTKTTSGEVGLADIDWVEIHNDTWGAGFTIYFDGVGFGRAGAPDTAPPSVSFRSPAANAVVSGATVVEADAWDLDTVVITVEYYVDGRLRATDGVGPYKWKWNTAAAADGPHLIKATARDLYGNAKAVQRRVTVANGAGRGLRPGSGPASRPGVRRRPS
jgi:hypothetical protein